MVSLEKVDAYNFVKIIDLDVAPEQKNFVRPNAVSLAQAYVMPECRPLAIYDGRTPVGFAMYALDKEDDEYWIYRLMIDAQYQRRGFGREAMRLLIERIKAETPKRSLLYISFEPTNEAAQHLYSSLGFVSDYRHVDGEIVYRLELK